MPPSTFFVGLISPPAGATSTGDLWIDVDDDAGSTEFVFAGPNPPAEGTYGMDTLWIDTDEPDLPLIYADEEPPAYTTVEGDFWVDLDDTSGQSILSSTTAPNPAQTEFWLDLTTEEGYKMYSEICDVFIKSKTTNLLNITGDMLASSAKRTFEKRNKYIPPELALGQLAAEGGIGNPDTNSLQVRTKNPFNVGNMDDGSTIDHSSVQSGIDALYNLIATDYIGKGKTAQDLINNFVNHENSRYAKGPNYEKVVGSIARQVNKIAKKLQNTI